jgi:hypothetical protein
MIAWTYKIDVTNVPDRSGSVTATRTETDDKSGAALDVRTYTLPVVSFAGAGKLAADSVHADIARQMYDLYLADKSREAAKASVSDKQEALLAEATNALEKK